MSVSFTPTFAERLAVNFVIKMTKLTTGEDHNTDAGYEFVRLLGVRGFFRYLGFVGKFNKLMDKELGAANTQTLVGLAALMAGCGFCGYGHTLTGALMVFKEAGTLHPVHPFSIVELFELEDHEVMVKLDEMLDRPGFEDLRRQVRRMYMMFVGELTPQNHEDELLKGIVDFWSWTVECTIVEGINFAPENAKVMTPVGRDKALRQRYESARVAERQG